MQLAEKCGRSFQPEQEKQRCFCFQASDLTSNCGRDDKCLMMAKKGRKKGKNYEKGEKRYPQGKMCLWHLDSKEPEALLRRIMNIHYLSPNMSEVVKLTSVSGCANNIITASSLTAAAHNTSAGGSSKTCFHTQSSLVFSLIFHFI